MEITREFLEAEIASVQEQAAAAANTMQQAVGATLALQSLIVALEKKEDPKLTSVAK